MKKRIEFTNSEIAYTERCIEQKRRETLREYKQHYLNEYQRSIESVEPIRFPMDPRPEDQIQPFVDLQFKNDSNPKKLVIQVRKIAVVDVLRDVWGADGVDGKRLINDFFTMLDTTFQSVEFQPLELIEKQDPCLFKTNLKFQVIDDIQQVIAYLTVSNISDSLCDQVKRIIAPIIIDRIENKTSVDQIVNNLQLHDIRPKVVSSMVGLEFESTQYKLVEDVIVDQ